VLNPIFFLSRAILVSLVATFLVVATMALASVFGIEHIVSEFVIGIIFAAGLAYAGARYGHQHAKESTTPRALETRLFLIQFALFLFILSALQFSLGEVSIAGHEFAGGMVYVPALVAIWVIYWCIRNVLTITEEQAAMIGSKRSEIAILCAGVLLAPFLLLIPGFALAEVFGFDPLIILAVFSYAPIMSAALPAGFSIRKLVMHQAGAEKD